MIAAETVIDEIAFALQMDPLDVRIRNFYSENGADLTPYYQPVIDFTVPNMVQLLEKSSDYRARRDAVRVFNKANTILKKGIALTPVKFGISFTATHLNQAGALLHLYIDGTVHLNHGGIEMGQGLFNIKISSTRTDKVPNTSATAASSGSDLNGMAALLAAREIKKRLVEFIMTSHECVADDVVFSSKGVCIAGEKKLSWQDMTATTPEVTRFYTMPMVLQLVKY